MTAVTFPPLPNQPSCSTLLRSFYIFVWHEGLPCGVHLKWLLGGPGACSRGQGLQQLGLPGTPPQTSEILLTHMLTSVFITADHFQTPPLLHPNPKQTSSLLNSKPSSSSSSSFVIAHPWSLNGPLCFLSHCVLFFVLLPSNTRGSVTRSARCEITPPSTSPSRGRPSDSDPRKRSLNAIIRNTLCARFVATQQIPIWVCSVAPPALPAPSSTSVSSEGPKRKRECWTLKIN